MAVARTWDELQHDACTWQRQHCNVSAICNPLQEAHTWFALCPHLQATGAQYSFPAARREQGRTWPRLSHAAITHFPLRVDGMKLISTMASFTTLATLPSLRHQLCSSPPLAGTRAPRASPHASHRASGKRKALTLFRNCTVSLSDRLTEVATWGRPA